MNTISKKTLVLGASLKPERYAHKAIVALQAKQHEVLAIGHINGDVKGVVVEVEKIKIENVHTITIYINIEKQIQYYDYIINLAPKRVIFNPGAENESFQMQLEGYGIEVIEACTLVMLSTGQY
jgi:predicted CoA-binding protein